MPKNRREQLELACSEKLLVRFYSSFGTGSRIGYVLDIGRHFLLFARIDDGMKFDGFDCVRIEDLRRFKVPAQHAEFVLAALRKQKQLIRRKPKIDLSSVTSILQSANKIFPLITIYRERRNPNVCNIGRIENVDEENVLLLQIDPDAEWEMKPKKLRISEITQIQFGGAYEHALYLVGGEPPNSKPK